VLKYRVDQHGQATPVGKDHIEGDFAGSIVHLQHRCAMRLVIDATACREQVDEAEPSDQVNLSVTSEGKERLVGLDNQTIRHRCQLAAGRPVVELVWIVTSQRGEERIESFARVMLV
jgi:hypothetical protein